MERDGQCLVSFATNMLTRCQALVEPLSVAWHALEQADIKPGDDVLIMGAGPIGLAVIQCLKARQMDGQIIVVELSAKRKEIARQCGASTVIDPREEDVVSRCRSLCDGQGPAVALECAGVPASINTACRAVRTKGLIVNVALWDEPVPIDLMPIVFGEKRMAAGEKRSKLPKPSAASCWHLTDLL